jgi:hypothetical protein
MDEKFNEEFNDIRLKQYSIAMEALNNLFHRIPFGEEIQFSDGRTGTIKPFFEPKWKEDGTPVAGIDIQLSDSHLEFELSLSGWGALHHPAFR